MLFSDLLLIDMVRSKVLYVLRKPLNKICSAYLAIACFASETVSEHVVTFI